jgi:hypothetical protein
VKVLGTLCFSILLYGSSFLFAKTVDKSQTESERYIVESERQWAESVASGEISAVERILADDFLGVSPEGDLYDKKKMVADNELPRRCFSQTTLMELKSGSLAIPLWRNAVSRGKSAKAKRASADSFGPIHGFDAMANGKS